MSGASSLALHRSRCRDPYCPACERAAENRKADRDEPLDAAEESARADQYERSLGL